MPIAALDLEGVSAGFASGLCSRAEGRVRATVAGDLGGIALPSGLSGDAALRRGAMLLPLGRQSGMEQLNLRFFADGRYRVELTVRPTDAARRPPDRRRLRAGEMARFARLLEGSSEPFCLRKDKFAGPGSLPAHFTTEQWSVGASPPGARPKRPRRTNGGQDEN